MIKNSECPKKQKNRRTELMHNSQSRGRAASHQKLRPVTRRKIYIVFKLIRERSFALNGCHSIAADASTRAGATRASPR